MIMAQSKRAYRVWWGVYMGLPVGVSPRVEQGRRAAVRSPPRGSGVIPPAPEGFPLLINAFRDDRFFS